MVWLLPGRGSLGGKAIAVVPGSAFPAHHFEDPANPEGIDEGEDAYD
jgi:hypothetical protein